MDNQVSSTAPISQTISVRIHDYWLSVLAGFFAGLFLIPTLFNSGYRGIITLALLPFIFSGLSIFGVWLGRFLSKWYAVLLQISKFAVIGVLNTAINFGILNILSLLTGVTSGFAVGGYNVPGTLLAACNSYVWNKLWVFKKAQNEETAFFADIPKFAVVTLIGLIVNSLIIVAFTTNLQPAFGLSKGAWLNLGKIIATLIGVVIDFLGYKFIVFKTKTKKA